MASDSSDVSDVAGPGLREKTVGGLVWSTLERWGARLISTVTFITIARHVEPEEFGVVALAASIIAIVSILQRQGLGVALVQRRELDDDTLNTAFWSLLGTSVVLAAVIVSIAAPISRLLSEPLLAGVIQAQAVGMVIAGSMAVPAAVLQRDLRFRPLATRRIVAAVAGGATGLGLAISGAGVWALVVQGLVDVAVSAIILWTAVRWRPGRSFNTQSWRGLGRVGGTITLSELLNVSNRRLDDFLIGTFLGATALGYYAVAYRFLLVLTELFIEVISVVALPAFARMQGDAVRAGSAMSSAVTWTCFIAFPAFAGLAVIASDVIAVAFGGRWAPSVPVMQVLAFSGLVQALKSVNGPVLIAFDRAGWVLKLTLLATVINIIGFAVGLHWGIVGVAVGSVVRGFIVTPVTFRVVRRVVHLDLRALNKRLALMAAAAMVMCAVVQYAIRLPLVGSTSELRLIAGVATGLVAYLTAARVLQPRLVHDGVAIGRRFVGKRLRGA